MNNATIRVVLFLTYHAIIGPVALVRRLLARREGAQGSYWGKPDARSDFASPY